jgi:transglutaminase-like putative cysteine protease
MQYAITHTTTYHYTDSVSLCHNLVHLKPRSAARQLSSQWQLAVTPEPRAMQHHYDYFGNPIAFFTIQEPHKELKITAKHQMEVSPSESMALQETPAWETVRDMLTTDRSAAVLEAGPFRFDSHYIHRSPDLAAYAQPSFPVGRPIGEAVLDLTARIHREFRYDAKATTVATPLHEVLTLRHGVCQDFAHLAIGCLRSLGLPARYVSGYLSTRPAPGRERLVGADASHAWLSVFLPGIGWVDFDPTNNAMPSDQHLTIAWGRDYDDVSPIKGVILGGGTHTMTIAVDVAPV